MKTITISVLAASLALTMPAFADDAHHPEKAAEAKSAPAQIGPQVKKMQPQLDRIANAKTDAERQKAMAEHMQTMQENIGMARGMQSGMMGCPMMERGGMGMMGGSQGMAGADDMMAKRMEMMEKRMDMMQMMMQGGMGTMQQGGAAKPAN